MIYTIEGRPISINSARAAVKVKGVPRLITTKKARAWKTKAAWSLIAQRGTTPCICGPCEVSLTIYLPTRAGDADNYVKMVLDALQTAAIIANDRQVQQLTVRKEVDKARPRVEISIATRKAA
jgi:Holliday junction resolvase RusA-like endonuclease